MEVRATLLSASKWQSKTKQNSIGYYVGLSYEGKAKRVFTRFDVVGGLGLIPSPNNAELFVPKGGVMPVILDMEIGGFGDSLGLEVKAVRKD